MRDPWSDDDWVMISALEHWAYCPRQCALIHLESVFDENVFTLRGRLEHQRVDEETSVSAEGVTTQFALPLRCERLGVYGKADAVEFWPDGRVVPVEYKHGKRAKRGKLHDAVQLAAQAMCLEEMLGVHIPLGAVFYRKTQRRQEVAIDEHLRAATEDCIRQVRSMLAGGETPPPVNDKRCPDCSLIDSCQPELVEALARAGPANGLFMPGDGEGLD